MAPNPYKSPVYEESYKPPWAKSHWARDCGIAILVLLMTPIVLGILLWLWMLVDMVLLPVFLGPPKS